jgi:hypothetical protein
MHNALPKVALRTVSVTGGQEVLVQIARHCLVLLLLLQSFSLGCNFIFEFSEVLGGHGADSKALFDALGILFLGFLLDLHTLRWAERGEQSGSEIREMELC